MIRKEELNEEQKEKLEKLYRKYLVRNLVAIALYCAFLFTANIVTIMACAIAGNPQFAFLGFIGNTMITVLGIMGTVEENQAEMLEKVRAIVGHL